MSKYTLWKIDAVADAVYCDDDSGISWIWNDKSRWSEYGVIEMPDDALEGAWREKAREWLGDTAFVDECVIEIEDNLVELQDDEDGYRPVYAFILEEDE